MPASAFSASCQPDSFAREGAVHCSLADGPIPLSQFVGCRESEPIDFSGKAPKCANFGPYIQYKKGTKHAGNTRSLPEMQVADERGLHVGPGLSAVCQPMGRRPSRTGVLARTRIKTKEQANYEHNNVPMRVVRLSRIVCEVMLSMAFFGNPGVTSSSTSGPFRKVATPFIAKLRRESSARHRHHNHAPAQSRRAARSTPYGGMESEPPQTLVYYFQSARLVTAAIAARN